MNELALFAGAGGGILGGKLLGWTTVCAVEWEPYPASVLIARQNEGFFPPFPIWDDVRTFDGRAWRGRVDVVSGGFPCQDISAAGKGAGIDGERSGMWAHMARIICEVGPRFAFVENSPMLTSRGLGRVLGDLAAMGYDARWGVLGAVDAGAPHKRERIWIVAHAGSERAGSVGGETDTNRRRNARRNESALRQNHGPDGADRTNSASEAKGDVADAMRQRNWGKAGKPDGADEEIRSDGIGGSHEAINQSADVADAEKQFARGLPIGTSSEYPRLGVSGENVADAMREGLERSECAGRTDETGRKIQDGSTGECGEVCDTVRGGLPQPESKSIQEWTEDRTSERTRIASTSWWAVEPNVGRVAHGVAARVDRLKAIGNGQVPAVAALAWEILSQEFDLVI